MKKILASKEYVNITIEEKINNLSASGFSGSWNDLTDKPFGEEGSGATIEWDGNTEGRDSAGEGESGGLYLISELTPSVEELTGAVLGMYENGVYTEVEIVEEYITTSTEDIVSVDGNMIVVAYTEGATVNGIVCPKPGVYFISSSAANMYVSKLTYGSTIIHTLDEKFIPDTIARSADIPTDDHINELINTALGVIENGTY